MSVEKQVEQVKKALRKRGWRVRTTNSSKSESVYITAVQGNKQLTIRVSDHMYCNGVSNSMINICPNGHSIKDVLLFVLDPSKPIRNIYYERKLARKRHRILERLHELTSDNERDDP